MKTLTLFTLTLLLTTAMALLPATAQQDDILIPDDNLASAIREALDLPTGAAITVQAMRNLTRLEAPGKGIADLAGLEHATNLTLLDLGGTWVNGEWQTNPMIADIAALANLTQLTRLNLDYTAVSDVSALANLTQLTRLNLGRTAVSDVSALANLTQLTRLDLHWTDVSDVSALANLTQLTQLDLHDTAVSDVYALANLTQLTQLDLHDTAVSDVAPLANLTQLTELNLKNCPLNAAAHQVHIPAIQANGTEVLFSPFQLIHLPRVPWLVSLIYFRPSDRPVRPNVDAEIDALIKKAQRFFADQLERHGFGRKTFQFDTDAHGNAVVHHVTGKFPNAHYQNSGPWQQEIDEQIYIPPGIVRVYMLDSDPEGRSFTGAAGIGSIGGFAAIDSSFDNSWYWKTIAHELAHAFGLVHDWRADANAKRIRTFTDDPMLTSFCAAEWLSVHPAFNPGQPRSTSWTTIKMLPPTLASPPNTIRLRFEVTDRDGLHQAQLQIKDFGHSKRYGALIDCQRLTGDDNTVEFMTTELTPQIESVTLSVIDVRGSVSWNSFDIDVLSLLPPAKVVSLPDPNLAAAVRETLSLSSSEAITTHAMWELTRLDVPNRGIRDLTGLAHATNLTALNLSGEYISGEGYVNRNAISDFSPLGKLTNLSTLDLGNMSVFSDVAALANLTQLTTLTLSETAVSDVAALANLTQLTELNLDETAVSDVAALANLTQLTELNLDETAVSDVAALANLTQLTYLILSGTAVSDVAALANLTQLTTLTLYNTNVSDVSALANLTQLTLLHLNKTAVSDVSALANLTQLTTLRLNDTNVSDVSALANLTQLTRLWLQRTAVSDVSALANLTQLTYLTLRRTAVSDVSALANLTQLTTLVLDDTAVSDVSALANLTQLTTLVLDDTAVSDVSALANLTQLTYLNLRDTAVSDVSPLLGLNLTGTDWDSIGLRLTGCPLSYASIHVHIPAMQEKGIEVEFDNVAHPALLKVTGDGQEGAPGATLKTPFVVEAMDEHGKPIVGKTVRFSVLEGEGTLRTKTVETDARGKAGVTLTLGWYPDVNKVKATSEGIRSWVLFTAVALEEVPQLVADVNGDGIVNIQDLVLVSGQFGQTDKNSADVNGDGVVNIQDLVLVAAAFGEGAAAPSARAVSLSRLTASDVEAWLSEAYSVEGTSLSRYVPRGIAVLEQLLANLVPKETALLANYPNPFNPETWIPYQLANPAEVTVTIYAANGAVVRTLDFGHRRAGSYASRSRAAYWDGRNAQGEPVASGVYFYTLTAGDFAATRKMLILK